MHIEILYHYILKNLFFMNINFFIAYAVFLLPRLLIFLNLEKVTTSGRLHGLEDNFIFLLSSDHLPLKKKYNTIEATKNIVFSLFLSLISLEFSIFKEGKACNYTDGQAIAFSFFFLFHDFFSFTPATTTITTTFFTDIYPATMTKMLLSEKTNDERNRERKNRKTRNVFESCH